MACLKFYEEDFKPMVAEDHHGGPMSGLRWISIFKMGRVSIGATVFKTVATITKRNNAEKYLKKSY